MDGKEYFAIAGLIQDRPLEPGPEDVADLDNYREYEGDVRKSPHGKTLINQMLAAFDRSLRTCRKPWGSCCSLMLPTLMNARPQGGRYSMPPATQRQWFV